MGYKKYTEQDKQDVVEMHSNGFTATQISHLKNISRGTIQYWIKNKDKPLYPNLAEEAASKAVQCGFESHQGYYYLLGVYLGDGYINKEPRTYKIRLFQDSKYPNLTERWRKTLQEILPYNKVNVSQKHSENVNVITAYNKNLPIIFPQHGLGRKHKRKIELVDWQLKQLKNLNRAKQMLEGFIHSDGCIYDNVINGTPYKSIMFSNTSQDILDIAESLANQIGLKPTRQEKKLYFRKRNDVEYMLTWIEEKS